MAGYSGTPLAGKLGIKSATSLALLGAPADLKLVLPEGVAVTHDLGERADIVLAFFIRLTELEQVIDSLSAMIFPAGGLWIAWPKKAARVDTDLSDNHVRTCALERGLVDNKVCAISETWSALRVVWRKELRGNPPTPRPARGQ